MVLESPRRDGRAPHARRRRLRARSACASPAVDLFTDIEGEAGCDTGHRGEPPILSIRLAGNNPAGANLILKILAPHLFGDGTALVFDLPKYGDGVCLGSEWRTCLDILARGSGKVWQRMVGRRNRVPTARAAPLRLLRSYRPRPWLAKPELFHLARISIGSMKRFQVDGAEISDDDLARSESQRIRKTAISPKFSRRQR